MGAGPSVNEALSDFSDQLILSEDYYRKGLATSTTIFSILRRERGDVDRVIIAGSNPRTTAACEQSDFELVVFLKNQEPLHEENIIQEIRNTVIENCRNLKNFVFINHASLFITFQIDGIKYDLTPAPNFQGWFSSQYNGSMQRLRQSRAPLSEGYIFGPALSETVVEFLKYQPSFTQAVIRLAKYWNSKIRIGNYVRSRSLLIEMVAIKAASLMRKFDVHLGFKKFLELMANFQSLHFYFTKYYTETEIPEGILRHMPLVLDPVNPFNNLAHVSIPVVESFRTAARLSLVKLEKFRPGESSIENIFCGLIHSRIYNQNIEENNNHTVAIAENVRFKRSASTWRWGFFLVLVLVLLYYGFKLYSFSWRRLQQILNYFIW